MKKIILEEIRYMLIENEVDFKEEEIHEGMALIGGDSNLDSMNVVTLCLKLEDIAEEEGFEFDWTSENAMSRSKGIFSSVNSLAKEFERQKEEA